MNTAPIPFPTATLRNLSVLCYAQGFTLWHYRAPNVPLSVTDLPDFFQCATDMMAVGDMVLISATGSASLRFVSDVTETTVTLGDVMGSPPNEDRDDPRQEDFLHAFKL